MALSVENITFDSTDPDRLAEWWAHAVDGTINALAPGFFVTVTRQGGPGFAFQKVDDPTPGKNRVHVDFSAADLESEVKRLVDLGATETGRGEAGPEFHWVVFADPDGNAFCVAGGDVADAT
jgi:predicted enzyme related to lactoylglutathione lyase